MLDYILYIRCVQIFKATLGRDCFSSSTRARRRVNAPTRRDDSSNCNAKVNIPGSIYFFQRKMSTYTFVSVQRFRNTRTTKGWAIKNERSPISHRNRRARILTGCRVEEAQRRRGRGWNFPLLVFARAGERFVVPRRSSRAVSFSFPLPPR